MHDFNPGVAANGLFWIVQVPEDAVTVTEDTVTISLKNIAVVDQVTFPNPGGVNLGGSGVPATVSFDITYRKTPGTARHVRATSADPLSAFDWAGTMSDATNKGTFSVAYNEPGGFSAQGSFDSQTYANTFLNGIPFGEIGAERNGSFLRHEDRDEGGKATAQPPTGVQPSAIAAAQVNVPKFKGRIPIGYFSH